MNFLTSLSPWFSVLQVISALAVIVLVLLQQGKGADMGAAFGSGSAGSLFGAAGSANFFSRMTKWAAVVFFACTLSLAYIGSQDLRADQTSSTDTGIMQGYTPTTTHSTVPDAGTTPTSSSVPASN